MDSAATFLPLVQELPDTYYYVAFDMPGHGKSDAFPPGLPVTMLSIVEVIRGIVERMKWDSFVYLSHSMGFVIGSFYNLFYPGKVTKMVHLDPGPPLALHYYPHHKTQYWYHFYYDNFYRNFPSWLSRNSKNLTYDEAIDLMVRNRSLTEEQAEAVLSRALIPVGDGQFRLSWEARMKKIATVPVSEEILYTAITEHTPPTLFVLASENKSIQPGRQFASDILDKCNLMLPNCTSVTVPGGHDVHITNPEVVVPHVVDFLKGDGVYNKSKL
ncbi:serine hydrolase-like protein isoform X2 [Anticarsia gemmatalis]